MRARRRFGKGETMQQKYLGIVILVSTAFIALSTPAGTQVIVSGNDEKILWNDAGQPVFLPPGKDSISFIDIGDRENSKILTSIALENSIFGPPTNLAIAPNAELALVANSMTQTKDGEKWKPVPDNKIYIFDLKANPPKQIGTVEVGKQPSGLDINKKGDLALVTNPPTIQSAFLVSPAKT
jgi:DNA-binding beta-propeller fold protein YncE